MKQPKLKYHFHNPNPPDKSAEYILKILMQVNAVKAENAVNSAQEKIKNFVRLTKIPNFTEMQLMRGLRLHENF